MKIVNKKLKAILLLLGIVAFTIPTCATIYEDAEDNTTTGWVSYGNTTDATIENVEDVGRGSRVIKLTGDGKNTGYRLGNRAGRASYVGAWHNQTEKVLKWSMKYNEPFRIYIPITTEHGNRFLTYTNQSVDIKGKVRGGKVSYGLGEDSINGEWHTFTRDLEADWNAFMPDDPFVAVNGFFIRGSGYIDDVVLNSNNNSSSDTIKPIITLLGDATVTLTVGDIYTDAGAIATDNVDGNITANIQTNSNVDTSSEGNYTVTYDITDSSGNDADTVTRTVIVTKYTVNLEDGLVAHYEFEGNSNDSSGNGNDGVEHGGVSYVDGVIGQAGRFDGVDDYVILDDNDFAYDEFTLSVWSKTSNLNQGGHLISRFENIAQSYEIYLPGNNQIRFQINSKNDDNFYKDIGTRLKNTWYLIVMRYHNGKLSGWLNGEKLFEEQGNIVINKDNLPFIIGASRNGLNYFYNGLIDDLRIYNRALNEAEIKELYKMKDSIFCIQVITKAYNPITGEEREFPTPCDVPNGWIVVLPDVINL